MNQNITFIYSHKCHPVTGVLANSVCDRTIQLKKYPIHSITGPIHAFFKGLFMGKGENYFCESPISVIPPMVRRFFLGEKNKIIYRGIDGLFYEKEDSYLASKNPVKRWLLKKIIKNIDFVICDSTLVKNDAEKFGKSAFVCESFSFDYEKYHTLKPSLTGNIFISIGEYRPPFDHKGFEDLLKLFNNLKYELIIVGKNTEQLNKYVNNPKIKIMGFQKDLTPLLSRATFYIHLAKYEAGPISVLESAIAGLIPIVNSKTGYKDIVYKIDNKLIIKNNNLKSYIKMSRSTRLTLSKKAKKISGNYTQDKILKKFRKTISGCING